MYEQSTNMKNELTMNNFKLVDNNCGNYNSYISVNRQTYFKNMNDIPTKHKINIDLKTANFTLGSQKNE